MKVLTRRLRFRLERAPGEHSLFDRTGCALKMEPLASTKQLERFLLKMVAKQWFDHDRSTFTFIKKIKENTPITFNHQASFVNNSIFLLSRLCFNYFFYRAISMKMGFYFGLERMGELPMIGSIQHTITLWL